MTLRIGSEPTLDAVHDETKRETAPAVTVGVPFHDAGQLLAGAVRSVLEQSHRDIEVLLVNDGASGVDAAFARTVDDPRVILVEDGRHLGLAARLNEIARSARGRYVARMDADDVMHPERLARQVEFLDRDQEVDVLGTEMYMVSDRDRVVGRSRHRWNPSEPGLPVGLHHPTIVTRVEWSRANPYDERMARCQDLELWTRTRAHSRVAVLDEPLHYYRLPRGHLHLANHRAAEAMQLRLIASSSRGARRIGAAARVRLRGAALRSLRRAGVMHRLDGWRYERLRDDERVAAQRIFDRVRGHDRVG